jgi:hypothetical protein
MSDKRQKNQLVLAFTDKSRSEAPRESAEGPNLCGEARTEKPGHGGTVNGGDASGKTVQAGIGTVKATKEALAWMG